VNIEEVIFEVADALRYPVLVVALLSLAVVIVEAGALLVELRGRRGRGMAKLDRTVDAAKAALAAGDEPAALEALRGLSYNRAMGEALAAIVHQRSRPDAADRIAKQMAEYDYRSLRRLERTRILVRLGPAVGLMGTLIPLSPALAGLASGDVGQLSRELRVAFSITVAGLLIGVAAFAISLVRDRLYAQDYSDVEFVAAALAGAGAPAASAVEEPRVTA